jgi:hypothetical protein
VTSKRCVSDRAQLLTHVLALLLLLQFPPSQSPQSQNQQVSMQHIFLRRPCVIGALFAVNARVFTGPWACIPSTLSACTKILQWIFRHSTISDNGGSVMTTRHQTDFPAALPHAHK